MQLPPFIVYLMHVDLDEVFAYKTTKEVKMLDRNLGFFALMVRVFVVFYIVFYIFLIHEGHMKVENAQGHIISVVEGETFSLDHGTARTWDAIDAREPNIENGAVFIATKVLVTPEQKPDKCPNPQKKCSKDSDCPNEPPLSEGKCQAGLCMAMQWCPAESELNMETSLLSTLESTDEFKIWFKASIAFPSLSKDKVFTTMDAAAPVPFVPVEETAVAGTAAADVEVDTTATQYTVGDLLNLAEVSYDTVKTTGCLLKVAVVWHCYVEQSSCTPKVEVQRLDTSERNKGFTWHYADYYRQTAAGDLMRDLYQYTGVRLLVSSEGVGKKISFPMIVLQLSSGIALLRLANFFADFLMLYVMPERKNFQSYKEERTPDFSDLRLLIGEVEAEHKKISEKKNRFAAQVQE